MIAFLTLTQYHLFTAIHMKKTLFKDEIADIYVHRKMPNYELLVKSMSEIGVFDNIYYIDIDCYPGYINLFSDLILRSREIKKNLKQKKYKSMFCFNKTVSINNVYYTIFQRNNPLIEFYYIEDGFGTYCNIKESYSFKLKTLMFILSFKSAYKHILKTFLYQPEVSLIETATEKIPSIVKEDDEFKKVINYVFSYNKCNDNNYNNCLAYYFEQPLDLSKDDELKSLNIISNILGQVVIKLHPASKKKYTANFAMFKHNFPWEIIVLNNNIINKVLITPFSTAAMTPKLLFDEEPIVVFTYKLFKYNVLLQNEKIEKAIMKFKNNYRNTEKVFIPETLSDLESDIKKIKRMIDDEIN